GDATLSRDLTKLSESDLQKGEGIGVPIALVILVFVFGALVAAFIPVFLAVGIDYSLFVVSRFREERTRGLDVEAAIERSAGTAGRAVMFSGLTVVLALVG